MMPSEGEWVNVGDRLRVALRELGITQAEFARKIGGNTRSATNYVRGKALPDTRVLLAIRENLGLSVDWLLHGSGEMFPNRRAETSSLSYEDQKLYLTKIEALKWKKRRILGGLLSLLVELQSADRYDDAFEARKKKGYASRQFVDALTEAQGEDWDCLIAFLVTQKQEFMAGRMVDFESRYNYFSNDFIETISTSFRSSDSAIKTYEKIRERVKHLWLKVIEAI